VTIVLLGFPCLFFGCTERGDNTQMTVLGHKLSSEVRDFLKERERLLGEIDFRDIAEHPFPVTRQLDGAHESDGDRHTVWLKPDSKDFEVFLMHEVMHGVLDKRGYPTTARSGQLGTDQQTYSIGSLLMSVVQDLIIDDHLVKLGLVIFDRQEGTQSKYIDAYRDAQNGKLVPYGYLFCKWALLTFYFTIDDTFSESQRKQIGSQIKNKFPKAFEAGEKLAAEIKLNSLTTPSEALAVMLKLRNDLKLHNKVYIVDHNGNTH